MLGTSRRWIGEVRSRAMLALASKRRSFDGGAFISESIRPRSIQNYHPHWVPDSHHDDVAIVLQGGLGPDPSFVAGTVAYYRQIFPHSAVIVSTWSDETPSALEDLGRRGAKIVLSAKPRNHGTSNANLQMVSSCEGVAAAARMGVSYVLKSRSDQRIYSEHALSLLKGLVHAFPLGSNSGSQQARLVAMSLNSFLYRLYGISDMLTFGTVADVVRYWDGHLDDRPAIETVRATTHREFSHLRLCEVSFCADFLEATGWQLQWSLSDSWQACIDRFCIVDASSLDLLWPKYTTRENRWRSYDGNPQFEEWSLGAWIAARSRGLEADETILDLPWPQP